MIMKKSVVTCFLIAMLFTTLVRPAFAAAPDTTDRTQGKEETIASLVTVQERLEAIEASKGEAETYLRELEAQLTDLSGQLEDIQEKYSAQRAELDRVTQQLSDAEHKEAVQRESMALRIQYMYENSTGNGLLDSVFCSDDFQDILTQAANIRELSKYDRELLDEYTAVCGEIEAKRAAVEKEQGEILKLEEQSKDKRAELQTVYEETQDDIREMAASIEEGHEEEALLLASIQEQESEYETLFVPASDQVAWADNAAAQYMYAAAPADPAATAAPAAEEAPGAPAEQEAAEESAKPLSANEQHGYVNRSTWDGSVLTRTSGVNQGPNGKETYYNLDMTPVVNVMRNMGNTDEYWVRDDGVKMLGDYVMVAANLNVHERGSIVDSSLGEAIVVDTGGFAYSNPEQLDIAVAW